MSPFFHNFRLAYAILIILACLLVVFCKSVKSEILSVPGEYDGVQPKDPLKIQYFSDAGLRQPQAGKPIIPNVKSIPIKSRRRLVDSGKIILELTDGKNTFYADETKFLYNYANCEAFQSKKINNASSFNNLKYSGQLIANKVQLVRRSVLHIPERHDYSLDYSSYIMQIGNESFVVGLVEKLIAYCAGSQPVSQIMDNLVIKDIPEEFMTVCDFGTLPKDEIIVIKFARPIDQSCFHKIKQAWRYDIEKSRFIPEPHENLKCGIPSC